MKERPTLVFALLRDFTTHLFSPELHARLRTVADVLDDEPLAGFDDARAARQRAQAVAPEVARHPARVRRDRLSPQPARPCT